MKIVVNRTYGGFRLPEAFCRKYGIESPYADIDRNDERLIDWLERNHSNRPLEVVEIPNNITDWTINEYDGAEQIIYVQGGLLFWA